VARTNLTDRNLRFPLSNKNRDALRDKLAEHDTALDALEGGSGLTGDLTLAAAKSLIFTAGAGGIDGSAATGPFKIGAAGATVGFYGATAVAKPSAYTQTYSTATRTHATPTAATLTDSSTGTSGGTTVGAVSDTATAANAIATLTAMVNKLTADAVVTKGLVNALIDDHQALGLA